MMQYRTERERSAAEASQPAGELANGSEAHIRRTGGWATCPGRPCTPRLPPECASHGLATAGCIVTAKAGAAGAGCCSTLWIDEFLQARTSGAPIPERQVAACRPFTHAVYTCSMDE
jgi:hypothetical protein